MTYLAAADGGELPIRNANSATGDGRASVAGACGGQNTWGANGNAVGQDGPANVMTLDINYAAGHASPNNVFSMAFSCEDTSQNGLSAAAAKLTAADGCTCTSGGADIGYPCPAPQAIVPGGYRVTCTLPQQNIQLGETKDCTVSLLDQRDWGGCVDIQLASAAAILPPAPPPAPIIPSNGVYKITKETSTDTSASTFTCCPLEADLTIPQYVQGAGSFSATLEGKADGCRTSSLETAPNDNNMVIAAGTTITMTSSGTGGKYEGTLLMGLPSQPFEFVVENGVMSFTNVGADQPIICDGFSSLPGATVGGQVDADPALGQTAGGADGGTTAAIVIVVIVCLCALGGGYWYLKNKGAKTPGSKAAMQAGVPPPPSGMPAGWTAALDPASGRTYYVNAATGASQWDPPPGMGSI